MMMIHGMWGRPGVWENFRPYFTQRGFDVHAPALRHHESGSTDSGSDLGKTSLIDYAGDLEAAVRRLDSPPILVGHSMGGLLAQQLAGRGLARALVLLAPVIPPGLGILRPSMIRIFRRLVFRRRFWARPQRLGQKQAAYGLFQRLAPAERDRQIAAMSYESGRVLFELALSAMDHRHAALIDLEQIRCPVLIVAGARDRIVPLNDLRRLAARYGPRARYIELPEHGHWLMGEPGWPAIADVCMRWLDEIL